MTTQEVASHATLATSIDIMQALGIFDLSAPDLREISRMVDRCPCSVARSLGAPEPGAPESEWAARVLGRCAGRLVIARALLERGQRDAADYLDGHTARMLAELPGWARTAAIRGQAGGWEDLSVA